MKTTMIRDVLTVVSVGGPLSEDAPEAAQRATDELKALEESHAEMAAALKAMLEAFPGVYGARDEFDAAESAKSALRKAGLL